MKDAIIAKLANQAADFYGDAFKQCQYKENLPKVCSGDTRITLITCISACTLCRGMPGFAISRSFLETQSTSHESVLFLFH